MKTRAGSSGQSTGCRKPEVGRIANGPCAPFLVALVALGAVSGCSSWQPDPREVAALHAQIDNLGKIAEAAAIETRSAPATAALPRIRADVAATHSHATKATTAPVRS